MNWIDKRLAKSGPKRSQNKQVDALKYYFSVVLVFFNKNNTHAVADNTTKTLTL